YVMDGPVRALNKLVGHLERRGHDVLVFAPTIERPAFAHEGELVSVPSIAQRGVVWRRGMGDRLGHGAGRVNREKRLRVRENAVGTNPLRRRYCGQTACVRIRCGFMGDPSTISARAPARWRVLRLSEAALMSVEDEWAELAQSAAEKKPFYAPMMTAPA
ncbi:MAG: hypothetical protein AAGJ87_09735, partial [Pseudomonadota bacterium]